MSSAPDAAELVEEHLDFALGVAARWGRLYGWLADDFASEAAVALWRAAVRHDPARGEFRPFAWNLVRWACIRRIQVERTHNPTAFNSRPVMADGGAGDAIDLVADDVPPVGTEAEVRELLALLPDDRRDALVRNVAGDETSNALAAERGVSGSAMRQAIRRDLLRLRAAAGE